MAETLRVGIGVYVSDLISSLMEDDHVELHVILHSAARKDDLPFVALLPQAHVHRIAPAYDDYLRRDVWEQFRLPRFLSRIGADVYHAPNYYLPILRNAPCALAVTVHDFSVIRLRQMYRGITSSRRRVLTVRSLRRANASLFDSDFVRNEALALYGNLRNTFTSHLALPTDFGEMLRVVIAARAKAAVKPSLKRTSQRPVVVTIGSMIARKNHVALLEAMAIPGRTKWDLEIIGGPGDATEGLMEQIRRLDIADRVAVLDRLSTRELVEHLLDASVLVLPSVYEGFGLPILEGFAAGLPLCISGSSSFPEVAGDAAIYFDPGSPSDLSDKLSELLGSEEQRSLLVRRGKKRLSQFSWERAREIHVLAYECAYLSHRSGNFTGLC